MLNHGHTRRKHLSSAIVGGTQVFVALPDVIEKDTLLTTGQTGELLQVYLTSVQDWIKRGMLPASRTPGGQHRVRGDDVVAFLVARNVPIPE